MQSLLSRHATAPCRCAVRPAATAAVAARIGVVPRPFAIRPRRGLASAPRGDDPRRRPASRAPPLDFTAHAPAAATAPAAARGASTRKSSLKRVALIAQAPSLHEPAAAPAAPTTSPAAAAEPATATVDAAPDEVSAVCMAAKFDMATVVDVLQARGFGIDPDSTGFGANDVVHARARPDTPAGDVFVFPSGSVVAWSLPVEAVARHLGPAIVAPLDTTCERESEALAFVTDPARARSLLRHELIVLGTQPAADRGDRRHTTLAQIAFSSGLARATQLAVLEAAMAAFFQRIRHVPDLLSAGGARRLTRRFIMRTTGELIALRGRLNYYSELTDSVPDLLWEAHGLDTYYDQVGKALDVHSRIRSLNQKMDYANEVAGIMRQISAERHSARLEIIIIWLILVEVLLSIGLGSWLSRCYSDVLDALRPEDSRIPLDSPPQAPSSQPHLSQH